MGDIGFKVGAVFVIVLAGAFLIFAAKDIFSAGATIVRGLI